MADIALPILGKISQYLVAPIGQRLGYLVRFSVNVQTLKNELEKLGNLKVAVQQEVDVARRNVDVIKNTVETWLDRVSSAEAEAQRIVEDKERLSGGCFNERCLNWKSRYVLSRKAKKKTRDILELLRNGKFEKVSIPAPPIPFMVPTSTAFASRELILEKIIKKLKDENINMIGICGMGGLGKTTMVEKVFKKVKEENIFDEYAKAVVSQKADTAKIQSDLAEMLGLTFGENNPDLRASRMSQRLEGKKVLIIMDDVWEEFDLQALGITLEDGQSRCKIIFTSRIQGLWISFRSRRRELPLETLPYNESWNLFKEKIEDFLDDKPEFVCTAEKIVKECAGLPLALVTLGRALLGKSKHAWNDTLLKLRTISGVEQKVYESLRLSYDHLDNEEAKLLFLLCSLFEEDSHIDGECLVNIGMGLGLFKGINSVEAARDRVFALVEHLQSRCLVTMGKKSIKVHDVVRDVSKSIAMTEKGALVLEHGVTFKRSRGQSFPEHSIWISVISKEIRELPSRLRFPRLELLKCSNKNMQIPDSFFEGMVKLQVVDIICSTLIKIPSSVQSLTSLHTLCLRNCRLNDFTAIKFLQCLEILRVADKYIEYLPKEIGQLSNLMLLDMSDCEKMKIISPGIIACLTNLEELYLGRLDIDWRAGENEACRSASLMEFESLSNLHTLHILIKDPRMLPKTPLFKNLKKYQIQIGDVESDFIQDSQTHERILSISRVALEKDFNFLLHNSEALLLKGEPTKSLVCELVREASQSIKCLTISDTKTPEYLGNAMDCTKATFLVSTLESLTLKRVNNLQQIINGPLVPGNFDKLRKLTLYDCKQLRNTFCLSNAVDVLHLEELYVYDLLGGRRRRGKQKEVTCWEGREHKAKRKLQFLNLKVLEIHSYSLVSFCKGANGIEIQQLERLSLSSIRSAECIVSLSDENHLNSIFPPKVSFPGLLEMELYNLKNMKEIWCGKLQTGSFHNLTELDIKRCGRLEYMFSSCTARYLVHLRTIVIAECKNLKEVVSDKEEVDGREYTSSILPKLKAVKLYKLLALGTFCHIKDDLEFPVLDYVGVVDCPEFMTFSPGILLTPSLNHVCLYEEGKYMFQKIKGETLWKGNMNSTIQHLHEDLQQLRGQKQEDEEDSGNENNIKDER